MSNSETNMFNQGLERDKTIMFPPPPPKTYSDPNSNKVIGQFIENDKNRNYDIIVNFANNEQGEVAYNVYNYETGVCNTQTITTSTSTQNPVTVPVVVNSEFVLLVRNNLQDSNSSVVVTEN